MKDHLVDTAHAHVDTTSSTLFELSTVEFDVLAEHLGLLPVPLVLKVPSPGRTHTERAALVQRVWGELTARGLCDSATVLPELHDLMHVVARPNTEVDGRLWLQRSVRVLAAADAAGKHAALAVKDADTVRMRAAAPTGLAREALSVLPESGPGPGRSVSLLSSDLDAAATEAGTDVHRLTACLQQRGTHHEDAAAVTDMVRGAHHRGQFGAARRDRHGYRVRGEHVVGFFDTDRGRYVQLRRDSPSGQSWSTVAPVDGRRLLGQVEELLAGLDAR